MNQQNILPFYYPTTVMCIDDAEDALRAIDATLIPLNGKVKTYSDVRAALSHLNRKDLLPSKDWLSRLEDDEKINERVQSIQFQKIHHQLFNERRHEQVSVAIVDFEMPEMNGLELCKKITNPYTRKILLTGVADERIGVDALNQGIIHQYIRKQDYDLPTKLRAAVKVAQRQYFEIIASQIFDAYRNDPDCLLSHAKGGEFLAPFIQEAAEYYMCCATGSFIFLDELGRRKTGLVVKTNEDLKADIELTEDVASENLVEDLKARRKLFRNPPEGSFFGLSSSDLEFIAFSAKPVPEVPNFYVAENVDPLGWSEVVDVFA